MSQNKVNSGDVKVLSSQDEAEPFLYETWNKTSDKIFPVNKNADLFNEEQPNQLIFYTTYI